MKNRIFALILTISVIAALLPSAPVFGTGDIDLTATAKDIADTDKFYYSVDGTKVNISLNGTLDFVNNENRSVIIACYDDEILLKAQLVTLDAALNKVSVNNMELKLDKEPSNLVVKAFLWSGTDKCSPLCNAALLSDAPKNVCTVWGRVIENKKTNSLMADDTVEFRIEQADDFEGIKIGGENGEEEKYNINANVGNTDIGNHFLEYVSAKLVKNSDGDYEILSYNPVEYMNVTFDKVDVDLTNSTASKIVLTNGKEYALGDNVSCFVNSASYDADFLAFISNMPEKYGKIMLTDLKPNYDENSALIGYSYESVVIECYYEAEISLVAYKGSQIVVSLDNYENPVGDTMEIYNDGEHAYSLKNAQSEECDISKMEEYVGQKIYISFDITDFFYSNFYDMIIENAAAEDKTPTEKTGGLKSVTSSLVLRYDDKDETAMLDGELVTDSEGSMPYEINIDFIKDKESIKTETVKSDVVLNHLYFGRETGTGADYGFTAKKYSVGEKPDKAVISFDTGENSEIGDITVPVVSADAYKVYGRIMNTSRNDASIQNNQVSYRVEKADCFDGEYIQRQNPLTANMHCTDSAAPSMIREYSCAYIHKSGNEYTIEFLVSAAPSKSVTLLGEDFDEYKSDMTYSKKLYFFPHGSLDKSTKYALSDSYEVYINGVKTDMTDAELVEYISQKATEVTLRKETTIGSVSSEAEYNIVMIKTYHTAVVDEVIAQPNGAVISFKEKCGDILSYSLPVDYSNDSKDYSFVLNGEKIAPSDIEPLDVLNIEYDNSTSFTDSGFYDVKVTREAVSGKLLSISDDGSECNVDNTRYPINKDMNINMELAKKYNFYLDAFGRISYALERDEPKQLAVFKNMYRRVNGDWYAQLITTRGEEEYAVYDADVTEYGKLLNPSFDGSDSAKAYSGTNNAEEYAGQVIEYKITESGKLKIASYDDDYNLSFANCVTAEAKYTESTSSIGGVLIDKDTVILNLSNDRVRTIAKENFVDGYDYKAYGYDKRLADSCCRFVILTSAPATAIAAMEYYEDGKGYLYCEDEFLELQVDNEEILTVLQNARGDNKPVYIIHDYKKILGAVPIEGEKTTGVYRDGYIGDYRVPERITCVLPEIGIEEAASLCLIEGNSYDVVRYKKGGNIMTVVYGEIDESRDMYTEMSNR